MTPVVALLSPSPVCLSAEGAKNVSGPDVPRFANGEAGSQDISGTLTCNHIILSANRLHNTNSLLLKIRYYTIYIVHYKNHVNLYILYNPYAHIIVHCTVYVVNSTVQIVHYTIYTAHVNAIHATSRSEIMFTLSNCTRLQDICKIMMLDLG